MLSQRLNVRFTVQQRSQKLVIKKKHRRNARNGARLRHPGAAKQRQNKSNAQHISVWSAISTLSCFSGASKQWWLRT